MALERTMGIIKPEAVSKGYSGLILAAIEKAGLKIIDLRMETMTKTKAKGFYAVHKKRPFFERLITYMASGPVVLFVIEGDDAINRYRKLMGPTDATQAPKSTLRGKYGSTVTRNACHGSDGPDTAEFEITYTFGPKLLLKRKAVKKTAAKTSTSTTKAAAKTVTKAVPAAKKEAPKKRVCKSSTTKKETVKKETVKKPATKKTAARKSTAKKAPVKKEAPKKAAAKKAPAKKTATKKNAKKK